MLLVVGGHSREIGKTSVITGLIERFRGSRWTAVKITQFGHGICSRAGEPCECSTGLDHPYEVSQEFEPGASDSQRYLAAGAQRSFWLRTAYGQLEGALPAFRKIVEGGANVIVESNSILEFVEPDLYLVVLDFAREDFKASTLRFLDRADAFVVIDSGINVPLWQDVSRGLWDGKPQFAVTPPYYVSPALSAFVRKKLSSAARPTA
jgi:hypothetical protein